MATNTRGTLEWCRQCLLRCSPWSPVSPRDFPQFPPPPPQMMLDDRANYNKVILRRKYLAPRGEEETPLCSLYRLYEHVVLDRHIGLRNEIEYFWNQHTWAVSEIPDPADDDPARYAMLACIPHLLVIAFNNNIELGLPRDAPAIMTHAEMEAIRKREKIFERVPEWTAKVPPLRDILTIPHKRSAERPRDGYDVLKSMEDDRASDPFKEKNILIWEPHILFI
ncbi:MAG: hypothetical protein M1837_006846 [Sclerophora amabilis]|nr:MAG: hypothetical protein M1837_006846 [Sclerophora amabilis]